MCAWDYLDLEPEGPPETFTAKWGRRRRWLDAKLGRRGTRNASEVEEGSGALAIAELSHRGEVEEFGEKAGSEDVKSGGLRPSSAKDGTTKQRRVSFGQQQQIEKMDRLTRQTSAAKVEAVETTNPRLKSSPPPPSPDATRPTSRFPNTKSSTSSVTQRLPPPPSSRSPSPSPLPTTTLPPTFPSPALPTPAEKAGPVTILSGMRAAAMSIVSPITISLVLALIIALIPPIKALFVPGVEGWSGTKIRMAPDGRPALAFVQEVSLVVFEIDRR